MTLLHPVVYVTLDRVAGIPNLARLLGNSFGVIGVWAIEPVVVRLLHSQRRTIGVLGNPWLTVSIFAVMTLSFFRADVSVEAPYDFHARYGAEPWIALYRAAIMLYIGSGVLRIFCVSLRNGRAVRSIPQLRFRIEARLQTVGWAAAVLYALQELVVLALRLVGILPEHFYLTRLATLLLLIGFLGIFNGEVFKLMQWLRQYVALRQLSPLWWDLYRTIPGIALDPPASRLADVLSVRDVHSRLYRRVLEIRDGLVKLQPYSHQAIVKRVLARCAEGRNPADSPPAVAAVAVIVALQAQQQARVGNDGTSLMPDVKERALEGEVQYLRRLTRMYARLRANRSLVRETEYVLAEKGTEER